MYFYTKEVNSSLNLSNIFSLIFYIHNIKCNKKQIDLYHEVNKIYWMIRSQPLHHLKQWGAQPWHLVLYVGLHRVTVHVIDL